MNWNIQWALKLIEFPLKQHIVPKALYTQNTGLSERERRSSCIHKLFFTKYCIFFFVHTYMETKKRQKQTTKAIKKKFSIIYLRIGFTMYNANKLCLVTCNASKKRNRKKLVENFMLFYVKMCFFGKWPSPAWIHGLGTVISGGAEMNKLFELLSLISFLLVVIPRRPRNMEWVKEVKSHFRFHFYGNHTFFFM